MKKLAKEINQLLLDNTEIKDYLKLREEIDNDSSFKEIKSKLDDMRKKICKDKEADSSEYYELLTLYKNDERIVRFESLNKEIKELLIDISDILSLK